MSHSKSQMTHKIKNIDWIIFDFFWTLYRITPTPIALAQRFLKELKAPLPRKPIEIVRRFAIADGFLYKRKHEPIPASSIRTLKDIDLATINSFFNTKEWHEIEQQIKFFVSKRYLREHPSIIRQLFVMWHKYWREPKRQTRIIPETKQVLPVLAKRGYSIVVASNSPWDLKPIIRKDNISSVITKVITYKDTGYQKPSINFFRAMISHLPVPRHQIAFVGDSVNNDILPAQKVGVLPILLWRPGQHRRPPPKIEDVIVVNYLRDLLEIFNGPS
ncbi:MAG: HAD family hydrolase [Candidatus Ranarchaeia archaeon]